MRDKEEKMNRYIRYNVTKDTKIAFLAGFGMIVLSLLMIPFDGSSIICETISFILRDIMMIFGLGVVFVSLYLERKGENGLVWLGLSKNKMVLSLTLNLLFAIGLLAMFLKKGAPEDILSLPNLYASVYIMTAGIFEMTFIYGFLRMSFEEAFGVIPAILLTSGFYSFHHAGFQPEFLHLFFVGIMYCSVYYITNNLLIIFPFFWGVGALWDVLVSSQAGEGIKNANSFIMALVVLGISALWLVYRRHKRNKQSKN